MNLQRGKQLPSAVWYIRSSIEPLAGPAARRGRPSRMSAPNRATSLPARRRTPASADAPVALYRAAGSVGRPGSKLRRASEISSSTPDLDLATRLAGLPARAARPHRAARHASGHRPGGQYHPRAGANRRADCGAGGHLGARALLGAGLIGRRRPAVRAGRAGARNRDGPCRLRHRRLGDAAGRRVRDRGSPAGLPRPRRCDSDGRGVSVELPGAQGRGADRHRPRACPPASRAWRRRCSGRCGSFSNRRLWRSTTPSC